MKGVRLWPCALLFEEVEMATTPTGRIRYKAKPRLFRKQLVIVQIEERVKGRHEDEHGLGPEYDYCRWRDATVEDLTVKEAE